MITLARIFVSLCALFFGWLIIVLPVWGLIWIIWDAFLLPVVQLELIPVAPAFKSGLLPIIIAGIVIFSCYLCSYLLIPSSWVVKRTILKGVEHIRIDKEHPIYQEVFEMSKKLNISMPAIFVYDGGINAFASSSLFSSTIAISDETLKFFSTDEARWVVAHELTHLKYKDSLLNGLWISANASLLFFLNFYNLLIRIIFTGASISIMSYYTIVILLSPFILIGQISKYILKVSVLIFKIFDYILVRETEYRADQGASELESSSPGISVLSQLDSGFEPLFDMFATHPSNKKRIVKLETP